ncbi:MAG: DEAD/DEAH box helicase, partial [Anaerolineae bacterium]|nr:DEAD/DEAH box helicase [Anaerolineae bacterium]
MLLAPRRFNHRQPLWMTRLQAKKIMTAVADRPDFPLLLETWRTCLNDEFDLPALRERLNELRDGVIEVDECHTQAPSPFARDLTFSQINQYMYADDTP